jgi:peptide/nickel transport system substrate-binding protein
MMSSEGAVVMRWMRWAAVLALCVASYGASAAALRWSNQSEALSLDPYANNETMTLRFLGNVYDPLVTRDQAGQFVPWLAASWTLMEPTRWRFTLRPGVRFAEGEALTADDVVFSIRRAGLPSSGITAQAGGVAGVEKVDALTVDVVTKGPRPTLLAELSSIYIMSESWALAHGAAETANNNQGKTGWTTTHANGTGAYRITERTPDSKTVFERRPDWWGVAAGVREGNVTQVVFRPIRNPSTRIAALISGEMDLVQPVPVQDLPRIAGTDALKVLQGPEIRTMYIGLNNTPTLADGRPNPMHDRRVREAMYRSIDIEAIRRQIMRGLAWPTALFVPKGVNGYNAALDVRYPYDLAKARALMEQAGWGQGFAIGMECPNDRYMNDEAICTAAVSMLAKIGITVSMRAQSKAIYQPYIMNNRVDSYLQGWAPNSWDAYEAFFYNLATRFDEKPATVLGEGQGLFNMGRYSNPEVDAALLAISRSLDPAARQALIDEVHKAYVRDIPNLPLHQQAIVWGARRAVQATVSPDDSVTFRWVSIEE